MTATSSTTKLMINNILIIYTKQHDDDDYAADEDTVTRAFTADAAAISSHAGFPGVPLEVPIIHRISRWCPTRRASVIS